MVEGKDKEALIFYLNDDGTTTSTYAEIISSENGLLKFKTKNNVISIPISRVLKIKERGNG